MDTHKLTIPKICTFLLVFTFLVSSISAASKYYTEENKPYEFGFNIEGEQHRREKKDENGLIMGEFGFITADGVYHVTVYATDENGNFKILSMKNIRLGAAPDKPPQNATPITQFTTTQAPTTAPTTTVSTRAPFTTAKPLPIASCSHCSIPSTTEKPSPEILPPPPPPPPEPVQPYPEEYEQPQQPDYEQPQGDQPQYPPEQFEYPQTNDVQNDYPVEVSTPGQYDTPLVISGHLQTVDPSTVNHELQPGEVSGPPPGVTESNMEDLLYRFNYTVGFHGHHEEGYANGAKKGEYFINFRNGLATRVSYIANEHGYFPKISTVRLSDYETPHAESEKNPEFGLKGYEFKWFYVPKYHHLNKY